MQLSIPFAVGIGGCVGALLRFYISSAVHRAVGDELAFVGTLAVNLIGCFLIGVLIVVAERTSHLSPHAQRVLVTGLLGSLTTFSTFALHSVNLLQHGRVGAAIVNVAMNVVLGVSLTWLGMLAAGTMIPEPAGDDVESPLSSSETVPEREA
jgi:CrcB protein